jgi:hypothetical protein
MYTSESGPVIRYFVIGDRSNTAVELRIAKYSVSAQ